VCVYVCARVCASIKCIASSLSSPKADLKGFTEFYTGLYDSCVLRLLAKSFLSPQRFIEDVELGPVSDLGCQHTGGGVDKTVGSADPRVSVAAVRPLRSGLVPFGGNRQRVAFSPCLQTKNFCCGSQGRHLRMASTRALTSENLRQRPTYRFKPKPKPKPEPEPEPEPCYVWLEGETARTEPILAKGT
jgi:hypothetical protein